ncbi:MAG: alpha/beta fold hydrolase [Frankiaceae bacterium]
MTYGLLPGAEQKQVAVEGVRLALNVAGPARPPHGAEGGPVPVLLLHGVPQTAVAFRFLLPELAKDRRVLAPDLKGLGESEVRGPYDLGTVVRELAALVLHEVDGPVDVVGHDWGGTIGLALAGARPDLVRRLVVVSAPYRHVNLVRAAYIPFFALPVLPELAWRLGGRALVAEVLRRLWKAERPLDDVVRTHYERVYTDPRRVAAMLGYYRDNVRPRLWSMARGAVRSVIPPAGGGRPGDAVRPRRVRAQKHLVVWGTEDPVLPMSVAESVVRDLGADTTLVAFPGVGHFPLEEVPEDAVAVVAEFLREAKEALAVEPVTEPAGDPITEPIGTPITESITEPINELAGEPASEPAGLEMPLLPQSKASGRDPDAQRASAQRRVAEVKADTAKRAAARRAGKRPGPGPSGNTDPIV